jgi:hypothetical protein
MSIEHLKQIRKILDEQDPELEKKQKILLRLGDELAILAAAKEEGVI